MTTGKVSEQLVPFLPGFPFNPRDARFLGSPVDLVVFAGSRMAGSSGSFGGSEDGKRGAHEPGAARA